MSDAPWPVTGGLETLSADEKARYAGELLNNPVLGLILNDMEADAVDTWRQSALPLQREECWHRAAVINEMRFRLARAVEDYQLRNERERRKQIRQD
jgi:hypothetical protein